jgi:hypothetical protein
VSDGCIAQAPGGWAAFELGTGEQGCSELGAALESRHTDRGGGPRERAERSDGAERTCEADGGRLRGRPFRREEQRAQVTSGPHKRGPPGERGKSRHKRGARSADAC